MRMTGEMRVRWSTKSRRGSQLWLQFESKRPLLADNGRTHDV